MNNNNEGNWFVNLGSTYDIDLSSESVCGFVKIQADKLTKFENPLFDAQNTDYHGAISIRSNRSKLFLNNQCFRFLSW